MKFILATLVLAAASFHLCCAEYNDDVQYLNSDELEKLGHLIQGGFDGKAELPLPGLPDPLHFDQLDLSLSIGNLSLSNGDLWGLSGLNITDLSITPPLITLSLRLELPEVSSNGTYEADLVYEIGGTGLPLAGAGAYDIKFTGFSVSLELRLRVVETGLNISDVDVGLNLGTMETYLENFTLNGVLTDWEDSGNQEMFQAIVTGILDGAMGTLSGALEGVLNGLVAECSLTDIISGDLSCAGLGEAEVSTTPGEVDTTPVATEKPTTPGEPEDSTSGTQGRPLTGILLLFLPILCILY